jgi:hypothetical protein
MNSGSIYVQPYQLKFTLNINYLSDEQLEFLVEWTFNVSLERLEWLLVNDWSWIQMIEGEQSKSDLNIQSCQEIFFKHVRHLNTF